MRDEQRAYKDQKLASNTCMTLLTDYTGVHQSLRMEGSNLSEFSEDFQNFEGLLSLRITKLGRLQSLQILDFYVKNAHLY